MPGRITDQLRQITREQGGATPGPPSEPHDANDPNARSRRYGPLLGLVLAAVLAGIGWLLIRQLMADSKLQDCVMSGRKNCAPIEIEGGTP